MTWCRWYEGRSRNRRMVERVSFELCAETLGACAAANAGGADRIELCRALEVGGLTPELLLVQAAVRSGGVPVHVLLRPFADEFRTSAAVLAELSASLLAARGMGAAGVVLGLLRADGTVDVEETRALVRLAAPLPVTFHRAFDATPDVFEALEDVIRTGCARVLTSGGAADVLAGAPVLERLVTQAGGRIDVAIGGGLREGNAEAVARITGGLHFHASLKHSETGTRGEPSAESVRRMVGLLSIGSDVAV